MRRLLGVVEAGEGDAARWLARFNEAYALKVGMSVYPGSLNLRLPQGFDWSAPEVADGLIHFGRAEYGGERDILLLPCVLTTLDECPGFLWTTTRALDDAEPSRVIEVLASVRLRDAFGLSDGDLVRLELPGVEPPGDAPAEPR